MTSVWVTRTQPGASSMAKHLRRAAIQSNVAPLIDIQRITSDSPQGSFDLAVYLSQHAARSIDAEDIDASRHMAIGAATQQVLSYLGIPSELPDRTSSEGIVKHVSTRLESGASVLIVCGEDGRSILPNRLRSMGYSVFVWRVYRRVHETRKPRLERDCEIVELSSVTSVQTYRKVVRRHALVSTDEPCLVVPSRRIGKYSKLLGFERVYVTPGASSRSFVRVIRRLILND